MDNNDLDPKLIVPKNVGQFLMLAIGLTASAYLCYRIVHNIVVGYHYLDYILHYIGLMLLSPFMYYFFSFTLKNLIFKNHPNMLMLTNKIFKFFGLLIGFLSSIFGYYMLVIAATLGPHNVGPLVPLMMATPLLPFIIYFHVFVIKIMIPTRKSKGQIESEVGTCNMCRNDAEDGELFCADHIYYSPNNK